MAKPSDAPRTVSVQLNIDAITAVAVTAARVTADVVGLALRLIEEAGPDALAETQSPQATYEFGPPPGTPAGRYATRRRWLLTKGFQDLTVATRRACEEADLLLGLTGVPMQTTTVAKFGAQVAELRRSVNKANLPDLLARLEARIGAPLAWGAEILSLNRARNCLEHRRGVVTPADCDPGSEELTVTFPRLRVFYRHKGEEVELQAPHQMPEDAEDGEGFDVFMQKVRRTVAFPQGAVVDFDPGTFAEITFAVWFFANDLRDKVRGSAAVAALPKAGPKA